MLSSLLPAQTTVFADKADIPLQFSGTLPDYLPDIRRIVGADCRFLHCTASIEDERIRVIASGSAEAIFVAEGKGHLKTALFPFTLEKNFPLNAKNEEPIDRMSADGAVFGMTAVMTSPRTVEFRSTAVIRISAVHDTHSDLDAFSHDDICLDETQISAAVRQYHDGAFDMTEDIVLDAEMPAVAEIGQTRYGITDGTCRYDNGVIVCDAVLSLRTAYRAETDNADADADYIYLTKTLPLHAEMRTDAAEDELLANAFFIPRFSVRQGDLSVTFDSYGENRVLRLSFAYTAAVEAIGTQQIRCFRDAFCPGRACTAEMGTHTYETLTGSFSQTLHTTQTVSADAVRMTLISDTSARLCTESIEMIDGVPCFCGKAVVTVMGSDDSGMPVSLSEPLNIRIPLPTLSPLTPSEHAVLSAVISDCPAAVHAGDVHLDISLAVCGAVLSQQKIKTVDDIVFDDTAGVRTDRSAYIFCYPDEETRVWELAKRYDVSPECIRDANGLEGETVTPGKMLLIPRFV